MADGFELAAAAWLERAQARVTAHHASFGSEYPESCDVLEFSRGKRYWRVVARNPDTGSRSAFAFVDSTTGDVLKPASWKAPAKHARGNVWGGLDGVSARGAHYLR